MLASSPALTRAVLALSVAFLALALLMVAYVIARRRWRERDFRRIDRFRSLLAETFKALAGPAPGYEAALAKAREMLSPRLRVAMQRVFLERTNIPGEADHVLRVAEDLGFVEIWRRGLGVGPAPLEADKPLARPRAHRLFPDYATRARSAEYLGRVRHRPSWRLLVQALDDPQLDVREAALRSLAAIAEPQSVPFFVERLRTMVRTPQRDLSDRAIRSAWGRFPASCGGALLPLLSDPGSRLRRLAADCLIQTMQTGRQMPGGVGLESAWPEASKVILIHLAPSVDPELRARAAILLGFGQAAGTEQGLRRLLDDKIWFVRLHAVRAVAARKNAGGLRLLGDRLTDSSWRVREAAAQSLCEWGAEGLDQLIQSYLATRDAYARDQIIEALETSGHIAGLVRRYSGAGRAREVQALSQMNKKVPAPAGAAAPLPV